MSILPARRRIFAALAAGAATVVILPATAHAHVTIAPTTAAPGGYAREAFRVPNERDDAATVKLEVIFPAEHPLASVSVLPVAGWNVDVHKDKLATPAKAEHGEITEAVSSITWSGGSIGPGQFQEFPISLGPLPQGTTQLIFKALQTYSDGRVVRWIEVPLDGAPKPEHPAPVLMIAPTAPPTPVPSGSSDVLGLTVGGAGLVAGLAALGFSVVRRRPREAL